MAKGYPDFEGEKSGLYLKPEWSAKEGTDKNFIANDDALIFGEGATVTYLVPAGKSLYITQVSTSLVAPLVANSGNNQICRALVYDQTDNVVKWCLGGNGGAGMAFSKPIVIPTGHTVWFTCYNFSANTAWGVVVASGYEV